MECTRGWTENRLFSEKTAKGKIPCGVIKREVSAILQYILLGILGPYPDPTNCIRLDHTWREKLQLCYKAAEMFRVNTKLFCKVNA